MSYIAAEDVAKAKEMDLLTYLRNYEPQELVHVSGNTYCTREHDSLRISNGKWCWFSQGIGGRSALDYLIKVKGMKIIEQDSAKTKSSLRTLPLVGSFRDYFQKVKEAQELNKKVCGNCYNYEYDGYVFVNELGERMRPNYLTEYFPKYIAKHGMPKMRFHDLRHSCASLLLANGVPLKQIQEWLGHSDFSTTANIYAHLDYRSKISSAQAMEQGMLLPRSDDFGSRWENVTEQGKITEPDLNPGF